MSVITDEMNAITTGGWTGPGPAIHRHQLGRHASGVSYIKADHIDIAGLHEDAVLAAGDLALALCSISRSRTRVVLQL
jgi:hypothetical protein